MTKDQMMNLGLPKWPQMIVTGKPVSEEQALEIIRRTDSFFSWPSGNNHVYIEEAVSILNIPYRKPGESDGDFREFWSCKQVCVRPARGLRTTANERKIPKYQRRANETFSVIYEGSGAVFGLLTHRCAQGVSTDGNVIFAKNLQ